MGAVSSVSKRERTGRTSARASLGRIRRVRIVQPLTPSLMKAKRKKKEIAGKTSKKRIAHEAEAGASGALAGAVVGAVAGPPGVVAGAILGGVAGAAAGAALDTESSLRAAHDKELDAQIGVDGGDLGAPNLAHPPPTIGAYSQASTGVDADSPSSQEPAEGPMQVPEE